MVQLDPAGCKGSDSKRFSDERASSSESCGSLLSRYQLPALQKPQAELILMLELKEEGHSQP